MSLNVNEIFYSIQGEGPLLGVPSLFIRMAGCNLACDWCDSKYAWDTAVHVDKYTVQELGDYLIKEYTHVRHIVFTGGEPMIQEDGLYDVIGRLPCPHLTFETNGTIDPCSDLFDRVNLWMVSPKSNDNVCFSYGGFYTEKVKYKFVVDELKDLEWIDEFIDDWELQPNQVWLMPEATDTELMAYRLKKLVPHALEKGYNVTPRLQILIWGNKRGV